jgi:hypothetical protein
LSPENSRLSSPNEVGWIAKFDQTPSGWPSRESTRRTVRSGSTDAARAPASSCGTSALRRNGSKLRLELASVTGTVAMPARAGSSRASAAMIDSEIPAAVSSKMRGSYRSPPRNA